MSDEHGRPPWQKDLAAKILDGDVDHIALDPPREHWWGPPIPGKVREDDVVMADDLTSPEPMTDGEKAAVKAWYDEAMKRRG